MSEVNIYLVGGYVRDRLLGRKSNDLDFVVVGADNEYMTSVLGLTPDKAPFPVFRNNSGDEFAMARTERKVGLGHKAFATSFHSEVTLEEDLLRRDLTINSMAFHVNSSLKPDFSKGVIDPYGGMKDLDNKVLRHTSEAFVEDPLRVLRVARFASQLNSLGFSVHDDTIKLMKEISASGELAELTGERVWKETSKALLSDSPQVYFELLKRCGALEFVFPELNALIGVEQCEKHHPEIDCFIHTMMTLEQAVQLSNSLEVRYLALTHDLGKALTAESILPSHHNHEKNGLPVLQALNERLRLSNDLKRASELCMEYHTNIHRALELRSNTLVRMFQVFDVKRKPQHLKSVLTACKADARGRLGFESTLYPQERFLLEAAEAFCGVTFNGVDFKKKRHLVEQRKHGCYLAAIDRFKSDFRL